MSDSKKVKVWNRTKGMHHMVFTDSNRIIPIPAGSFQYIPVEEVYYVNSSSKSFSGGILEIDPSEVEILEELGYTERNPNAISVQEIEKLLEGKLTNDAKEKLEGITEHHAKQKVIDVARDMDLNQSKVDFIEEVTGIEVTNEVIKAEKKAEKKQEDKKSKGKK